MADLGKKEDFVGTARFYFPVTPNDTADLPNQVRALLIAVGGTLRVNRIGGITVDLTVPAGVVPIACERVHATGTSASGITGLV